MSSFVADVALLTGGLAHEPWVMWMALAAIGAGGLFAYIQMRL